MKQRITIKCCYHIVRSLLLQISLVALYITAYRNLPAVKSGFSSIFSRDPLVLFQFFGSLHRKKLVHDVFLRSFLVILLCIIVMLPIFKTLTSEISTDTIWFIFFLCQIIYCVGSVRASILAAPHRRLCYSRNCVIPLDESLLITKKIEGGNEASSIAAVIGFILLFSRIKNNFDIVYLQTIGFVLYFFLPHILEMQRVCRSTFETLLFIALSIAPSFFYDRVVCVGHALTLVVVGGMMTLMAWLM